MDDKRFEADAILEKVSVLDERTESVFKNIYLGMMSVIIETAHRTGDEKVAEVMLNAIDNSIGHAEKYVADRTARKRELEEKYRG